MLHLLTLGTLDLRRDDGTGLLSVVSQPKRIGLLCYLALARPRGFHRRDTLLPLFWPEADDEHARASLRQAVHYLRRSLGEQVVLSRGDEEVGLAAGELSCDAVAFEEALEAGEAERALGLYQGELLPGLFVGGAPESEGPFTGTRGWSERMFLSNSCEVFTIASLSRLIRARVESSLSTPARWNSSSVRSR